MKKLIAMLLALTMVLALGVFTASAEAVNPDDIEDTMFVFIDGWPLTNEAGEMLANVAPIAFREEQCGYFAG